MRRLMVGLLVAALAGAVPAAAQDDAALRFAFVVSSSSVSDTLGTFGANVLDPDARDAYRAALAHDRAALLEIDPASCFIELYVGYLEALALGEASVRLFEEMEVTAATSVTRMVSDKLASMDPASLGDCM